MADADDADVLAPTTAYSRAVRATYPFKRLTDVDEPVGAVGTLRVVYDRHFDRFFLREHTAHNEATAAIKSPKGRRAGTRSKPSVVKKRSLMSGVQWEDMVLPPRSVTKRSGVEGSDEYGDMTTDTATGGEVDAVATASQALPAQPPLKDAQDSVRPQGNGEPFPPQANVRNRTAVDKCATRDQPTTPGNRETDTPVSTLTAPNGATLAQTAVETTSQGPPTETPSTVAIDTAQAPALVSATTGSAREEPPPAAVETSVSRGAEQNAGDTAVSHVNLPVSMSPAKSQAVAGIVSALLSSSVNSVVKTLVGESVVASSSKLKDTKETIVSAVPTSKWTAAVRLLRALCRYARKRRALGPVASSAMLSPAVENTAAESQLLEQMPLKASASALRLDLSKLQVQVPGPQKRSSPQRKSPKKKARVASYSRHFEAAAASPATRLNHVDNQHDDEIRWEGDVVRIDIDLPTDTRKPQGSRTQSPPDRHVFVPHLYHFRDLARIRPHADGFRRVNDACTFTPLTSPSSSEDEEEDAVVEAPRLSSSDTDDDAIAFERGDPVLFYARHRWFRGTIVRRIKQSWFYDIRAANGTVFEAVQTKRIRRFEEADHEPKYVFEVGDRVLWQPPASPKDKRQQTYKARVVSMRRAASRGSSIQASKRYDLELLTGRIARKVAHAELRPYRS